MDASRAERQSRVLKRQNSGTAKTHAGSISRKATEGRLAQHVFEGNVEEIS
jgi:hypothetical protein